jgi:hypothetical protein
MMNFCIAFPFPVPFSEWVTSAERYWVTLAKHRSFADGLTGRVRFAPDYFAGVFEFLRDPRVFEQVFVDHGAVAWPGDIDLAPDAMYQEIGSRGEWLLTSKLQDAPV